MSNQYLGLVGTIGDVVLSKPIKSTHVIFKGGPIVNIYNVYKTSPKTIISNFVSKNCLFGAIKITNTINSDTDKWQCSGYGIGFVDGKNDGKNVIIFGVDLSNSKRANLYKK